jgi:SAM-dependent methyltransferase
VIRRTFDRDLLRRRRARRNPPPDPSFRDELAARLVDRLVDLRRRFTTVLELAAADDAVDRARAAAGLPPFALHLRADTAPPRLGRPAPALVLDPERLPFPDGRFDLVLAAGGLHWIDDLPRALAEIRRVLARDGLLLALFPGGASLIELRTCLVEAELELLGGAALRVFPTLDPRDGAALLQRAGFASPVVDVERVDLAYRDPARLLFDLRAAGESAAFAPELRRPLRRAVLARALELYRTRFVRPDGTHPVTVELVLLAGFGGPAAAPTVQEPSSPA